MSSILSDSTNEQQQQDIYQKLVQAYKILQQQGIPAAIYKYKEIIRQYPKIWKTYQNLGVAYIMNRQFQQAYNILKIYVQKVPRDPLGHDSLGVSESELDYPILAIGSFVNSINLAPQYHMSYYNLGVVLSKIGLYDFALNTYQRCLQLQPNYSNAMNNIGDIYKRQGKINKAINIFKQVIQNDPGYSLAVYNLANCYFTIKDYYNTILGYDEFIRKNGNSRVELFKNMMQCLEYYQLYFYAQEMVRKVIQFYHMNGIVNIIDFIGNYFICAQLLYKQAKNVYQYLRYQLNSSSLQHIQLKQIKKFKKMLQYSNSSYTTIIQYCKMINQSPPIECIRNRDRLFFNSFYLLFKLGLTDQLKIDFIYNYRFYKNFMNTFYHQIIQQRKIKKQIQKWKKYIKYLYRVKKTKKQVSIQEKIKYDEKIKVCQMFNQKYYLQYKSGITDTIIKKSFISRSYGHKYKRLILKRVKLIKKYKNFNKLISKRFKLKSMIKSIPIERQQEQSQSSSQ